MGPDDLGRVFYNGVELARLESFELLPADEPVDIADVIGAEGGVVTCEVTAKVTAEPSAFERLRDILARVETSDVFVDGERVGPVLDFVVAPDGRSAALELFDARGLAAGFCELIAIAKVP